MAGPFDFTQGTGFPYTGNNNQFLLEGTFDSSVQALAQNEVAELINIPANTFVQKVFYKITTGEGAARNFELGDATDTDGYLVSTSAQNAGGWVACGLVLTEAAPNTVTGYTGGKLYTAADTLDLKAVTALGLSEAVIEVKALCIRLA